MTVRGENTTGADMNPQDSGENLFDASDRLSEPIDAEEPPRLPFPVVGIGASAGGLEAVMELLAAMPAENGMAFVLVQHLPPDRQSLLADILSKRTPMPVREVADGLEIEPNHVYVIRPGHKLTVRNGRLHLGPRLDGPRAANRPIDDFFKSLAEEQRERAIGILMSGMGSNGSAGAQAIKAVGGLCIAQEPETAQFPSMPRHLIDSGNADYILRPAEMPDVLMAYASHPYVRGGREMSAADLLRRDNGHLREIIAVLRTRTRQEFSGYKKPTILRRIQRRMGLARVTDMGEYVKLLRQNPPEVNALADDLLIHVTGFFRDADAWEALRERVIVPLVASREPRGIVRCWVAACATGDEAYTLAILLMEEAERANKPLDIKIFATDMADRTLAQARAGVYPGGIEAEISPERLGRFFIKEDAVYRIRPDVRERVVFAPQNVLQDPPFSRLDIATCRNLLIYLEPQVQERVLGLLHFGLREGGTLFLGTSETVSSAEGMFEPIDKKAKIFRRIGPTRHGLVEFPLPHPVRATTARPALLGTGRPSGPRPTFASITQRALLEHHLPAAVLVDRDYRIQYYQGDTRPFLGPPRGEPTRDLMELALEGVRGAARIAIRRAAAANAPATVLDGWIITEFVHRRGVAVTASPAGDAAAPDHFVVSFKMRDDPPVGETAAGGDGNGDGEQSTNEALRRVREELQNTIEELQTSNEEMKAAAQEATSINEELQSSNEELETSKEEMQSLNEELNTVNTQLQVRIAEHQATSNDLASLLTSTDIAVLFLDLEMRIRRFTTPLRELMDLVASDAGRPLSDFARKFDDPHLIADAEAVLARLVPVEREVPAHNERWYLRRITPYRTTDNRIDGVVITFVDITRRKRAELEVNAAREYAESIVKTLHEPLLVLKADLTVANANESFYEHFKVTAAETIGRKVYNLGNGQWDIPALRTALEEVLPAKQEFNDYEVVHELPSLGRRILLLNGRRLDHPGLILLGVRDVTQRYADLLALRESEERLRLVVESGHEFAMLLLDVNARITAWNTGAERLLGYTEAEAVGQEVAIIFTPEDRAAGGPEQELAQAKANGRAIDERWHVRKGGTRFWGSGVMTAIRKPDGTLRGFVKVLRDETSRKRAEDAMQAAKEAAELASQTKDAFLATLSHELRTPLSAILLWVKMLEHRTQPATPEQLADGLAAIRSSAESQKSLIEDLLDTSRITSGKLRLQLQLVDLPSLVRGALDTVLPGAEAKGVKIAADLGAAAGTVWADPGRIQQVVWNLLSNAVKFTPAGGQVNVKLSRQRGVVRIRVADTGEGIEPAFVPHVFELFRQADGTSMRRHGGLGLGLAICKQLVELHGGTIRAESGGLGKGATFTIELPLAAMSAKTAGPPKVMAGGDQEAAAASVEGWSDLGGIRVLLVEDDRDTRRVLRSLLESSGAEVTDAGSAADAVAAFRSALDGGRRYDVVLSDIGLSGADGYGLIRELRKLEGKLPPTPAVALTAYVRAEDREKALAAGFQRHLTKPVEPAELTRTVASVAGR